MQTMQHTYVRIYLSCKFQKVHYFTLLTRRMTRYDKDVFDKDLDT